MSAKFFLYFFSLHKITLNSDGLVKHRNANGNCFNVGQISRSDWLDFLNSGAIHLNALKL